MTTIIARSTNTPTPQVEIACDSQVTYGSSFSHLPATQQKVIHTRSKDLYIGLAGRLTAHDALSSYLDYTYSPRTPENLQLARSFTPLFRRAFADYVGPYQAEELEFQALLVFKHSKKIFQTGSDFSFIEIQPDTPVAIGSGAHYAEAYLAANPNYELEKAVQHAANNDIYTSGEIHVTRL